VFNLETELIIWIKRKLRDVKSLIEAVFEDEQLLEDEEPWRCYPTHMCPAICDLVYTYGVGGGDSHSRTDMTPAVGKILFLSSSCHLYMVRGLCKNWLCELLDWYTAASGGCPEPPCT